MTLNLLSLQRIYDACNALYRRITKIGGKDLEDYTADDLFANLWKKFEASEAIVEITISVTLAAPVYEEGEATFSRDGQLTVRRAA